MCFVNQRIKWQLCLHLPTGDLHRGWIVFYKKKKNIILLSWLEIQGKHYLQGRLKTHKYGSPGCEKDQTETTVLPVYILL